jgi:hypothetical protein
MNHPTHAPKKELFDELTEFDPDPPQRTALIFGEDAKLGKVYFEETKVAPGKLDVLIKRQMSKSSTPGPGYYDTTIGFNSTRAKRGVAVQYRDPNETPNTHLARKRYFEEKASLAREEHDDLQDASDAFLRPHISSAKIVESKPSRHKADAKVGSFCPEPGSFFTQEVSQF